MKTKLLLAAFALALSTINYPLSTLHAQGALTPPGAPAPTMKSLDQIEARTAITNTSSLATISQPGSYYLTGNLTVASGIGIIINTNGVTLDLNGFTIRSTAAVSALNGIRLNGTLSDITILNGHIRGSVTNNGSGVYGGGGFDYGIFFNGPQPVNVLVSHVSVSGCGNYGIYLGIGDSTVVEACTVRTVGANGIYASVVKSCTAVDCGGTAVYGNQVSDCRGECSGSGSGVYADVAQNCYGSSSGAYGVFAAATVQNCYGSSTSFPGIYSDRTATGCSGFSSSSYGLYVNGPASDCHGSSTFGTGLKATTANNCTGSRAGGRAIEATVANGCYAAAGTNLITYKYNMP